MEQTFSGTAVRIKTTLSAPIELVWLVWTDAAHIAKWWGPAGFTNTIHQMDIQANGEWRLTMHGPDGKNYPNKSIFLEVVPQQKIGFRHYNPDYLATVIFEVKEKETVLDWTVDFETPELYETVVKVFKADEGLQQNVEKLKNYLTQIL